MTFTSLGKGGEYKHKLTTQEMPSHKHDIDAPLTNASVSVGGQSIQGSSRTVGTWNYNWCGYTGGSQSHNNVQPWLGAYYWRRTA